MAFDFQGFREKRISGFRFQRFSRRVGFEGLDGLIFGISRFCRAVAFEMAVFPREVGSVLLVDISTLRLKPTPQTSNPQPYTPNPEPRTPNPKPCTLNRHVSKPQSL